MFSEFLDLTSKAHHQENFNQSNQTSGWHRIGLIPRSKEIKHILIQHSVLDLTLNKPDRQKNSYGGGGAVQGIETPKTIIKSKLYRKLIKKSILTQMLLVWKCDVST